MGGYDRSKLRAELERDEALRLKVYRCSAGKRTIGIGRNLDDRGISPAETAALGITTASCIRLGITTAQAHALLESDIDGCEADLDRALPWWRKLSKVRQRVVLNMCFNLGVGKLLGFRNTLGMMQRGDYEGAARGMAASLWHDQVGRRAIRLEAMMRAG